MKSLAELKIFSGSSNTELATRISKYVGIKLGDATVTSFPDGETFVKINENIRGRDVFIIQSTCPPTNHHLMELFIMIDAARRASATRITAVIPFYGYARQDRKDQPRVPITAKLVANLVVKAGADRVIAMDLHAQQIQGFFDIPVDHLYAAPVFYSYLKKKAIKNLVVVSPDVGGMKMAHAYANLLGADLAIVAKNRKSATETEALYVVGDVKDKDVVMVDDLTETAGTLCSAAASLKKLGAKKIIAVVSHAILNKLSVDRLKASAIEELITTDTVPHKVDTKGVNLTVLSVADLLGEAILRIHRNESVNNLFILQK
ncbi:MAG: ribose-phosphate pyrophosphokinase [Verrucomicrobiota bacterium]|nr:ribose-phosphate pyrophosphokinase [Verrucomicrobiota bacterium]